MRISKGVQLGAVLAVMLFMSMASVHAVGAQIESITPSTIDVNITGPHVVYFNTSGLTPFENRQRLILQGNRTSTGCQYTMELKKTKNFSRIQPNSLHLNSLLYVQCRRQ